MASKKFYTTCSHYCFTVVFVFFFSTLPVLSQSKYSSFADSLIQRISQAQEDSNKVKLFLSLGGSYYQTNPDSFFLYTRQALTLARKINWSRGIANGTNNIGLLLSDTGNHALAITYLEESLLINRKIDATLNIINNLTNIGRIYYRQADFVKSSDYFFDALKIAEEINNHEKIAMIGTNLTSTFISEKDWAKAEKYALLTLDHSKMANAPMHTFKSLTALGLIRTEQSDTLKAKYFYQQALLVSRDNNFTLLSAEALSSMARLESNLDSALMMALNARKIFDALNPNSLNSITNLEDIGVLYMKMYQSATHLSRSNGNLQKAEDYIGEKIRKANELNYTEALAMGLNQMIRIQEWKGNYQKAYQLSTQYHAIQDSLYSQESKNKIASIEGKREVALRDKEIELNKVALLAQRKQNIALTSGVVLLFIIGALLYRQNRIRNTTNAKLLYLNGQLDEANKVKARFFAILSHDLRSPLARLINFLHLQKDAPDLLTTEQAAVHQEKIITSAENLLENMETVLLWSKGQMTSFKPVQKKIVVGNLFNQVNEAFKNYEKITLSFSDTEVIEVFTDENYLFTIMQNLTANAIKALHETPEPSISWKVWRENNDRIVLSISDNGPGLSEELTTNLFKEQEVGSAKTGFGFHIVRDLAKAIDCTLEVQSEIDKGTTFILRLHA